MTKDTLTGPGRGLTDGVLALLNPELTAALLAVVDAEITVDEVDDGE